MPSKSVKDLGVTLDRELTFDEHINNVVKCCNYSLCQISRVRHLFNKEHIEGILNSLVFSKLYFSSTVWSNTTKRNVAKLQQVQNFAARIVDNKKKFEHITPTLKALKWLPVSDKLVLNDAIMTYKCMNGQAPSYLCSKIINMCEQTHRYNTRFQSSGKIKQQLCRTSTGQRSFLVRAINLLLLELYKQFFSPFVSFFSLYIANVLCSQSLCDLNHSL